MTKRSDFAIAVAGSQPPPFRVRHNPRIVRAQSFYLLILATSITASSKCDYMCKDMTNRFRVDLGSIMNKGKLCEYVSCNKRGFDGASSARVARTTKMHASQSKRQKLDSGLGPVGHVSLGSNPPHP